MSCVHQLTAADLRQSRLHLFRAQVLLSVVVVAMIIWEITRPVTASSGLADRAPLGSFEYLTSGFQITVLVLLVTVWIVPRMTLLWMVSVAWMVPLTGVEMPTMWRVLAVVCLGVLAWMLIRSHRAQPDGRRHRLAMEGEFEDSFAFRRAGWGWAAVVGGLAVTIGLLLAHQTMLAQTQAFENRATADLAEILSYDDDNLEMSVRIGSTEFTLGDPLWDVQPDVGELVPVLLDPEDPEHIVFAATPEDPSWLLGLAFAAPLPGLGWGMPIIVRSRRRRRLATAGAPASMVALTHSPEHDYEILPMNGSSPLVRVVNMQGLVPRGDVLVQGLQLDDDDDDGPDPSDDGDPDEDDPLPEHDWELAAWADESTREMQEWVDDLMSPDFSQLDDEDKALVEAEFGPEIDGRETFTMLGSWSHGSSVALVRSSGQVWMGEIREPRLRADGRGLRRSGSEPRRQPVAGWGDVWVGRTMVALAAWSQRNSRWLRWVVALGVAVAGAIWVGAVVRFGVETGWDWFDWVMSVVLTVGLLPWPVIAAGSLPGPDVARARPGIAFYGFVMDVVIAPDRLVTVVPGEESVALRLRDPEDAVFLAPEEIGADLNASQAAEKLRSWSLAAPTTARSGPRPSAGVVGMVVMVAGWVVQILPLVF